MPLSCRRVSPLLLALALAVPLYGCASLEEEERSEEAALVVVVTPSTAAPGQLRTFQIQVPGADWGPRETAVELGADILPVGITATRSDRLEVVARVAPDAALGT